MWRNWGGDAHQPLVKKKKFQKFQMFSADLERKGWPKGCQPFPKKEKETYEKLIDELFGLGLRFFRCGVDTQGDYPADMQVGEGIIPLRLPEGILAEDPQNQLRKASMEDAGSQGCEDLRNRSISEALEVFPKRTVLLRKNVGDIPPELYGGSADGDLPSEPIMEGFSPQVSYLQVSDLCSGGEITRNPGGNNTLLTVPADPFVSAEPSADERDQWAEWAERQLRLFDRPIGEIRFGVDEVPHNLGQDVDMQLNHPGQNQVDEVWEAAANPDVDNAWLNEASLPNFAENQFDNSQGWHFVPIEDLISILSDIDRRASMFPGMLPKFEWSEEAFRSFVFQLEMLEGMPSSRGLFYIGALVDDSNTLLRTREGEILPPLHFSGSENPQEVTSMAESLSPADEFWSNFLNTPEA